MPRETSLSTWQWLKLGPGGGQNLTLHLILFFVRGRFGQVHKCEEKATGLKLAAKIIKTRGKKDKVKAVSVALSLLLSSPH